MTREQIIDEAVRRTVRFRQQTRPRWIGLWMWFLIFPNDEDLRDIQAYFTYLSEGSR